MVIHPFLFFLRAKTHRGGQDAETQRNYGALGLTFRRGGQALRLSVFAACPAELLVRRGGFFLLYSRKDPPRRTGFAPWRLCAPYSFFIRAKAQRNCFSLWTSCQPEAFAPSLLCSLPRPPRRILFLSRKDPPQRAGR